MSHVTIKLPTGVWTYDPAKPLGRAGGFGAVFAGKGGNGQPVAVKKLHITASDAAHRELRIAGELAGRRLTHVMPILDAGQDADSDGYYVVMPVAEGNLQDVLDSKGAMPEGQAIDVLRQIVDGLIELPDIVHRDLKPANVLLLDGEWRIADFGIARFVEESTSARTLKDRLSPQFAAPEQWTFEAATHATDVYAFGCVAYALLTGAPPFSGSIPELQNKHLHDIPPKLANTSPQVNALVTMAMRKEPPARPSLDRIKHILANAKQVASTPPSPALTKLANAAAAHEDQVAQAAAAQEKGRAERARRNALATEAKRSLRAIAEMLAGRIRTHVPSAAVSIDETVLRVQVGSASLQLYIGRDEPAFALDDFPRSEWDVICGAYIEVEQGKPLQKRSASLWYTRQRNRAGDYRWYEAAYEGNPLTQQGFEFEPAAANPELADRAHWTGMDIVQVSYGPYAIDDEDVEAFLQRWTHILAEAASGGMQRLPRALPAQGPY